jgi:hypothetical protein
MANNNAEQQIGSIYPTYKTVEKYPLRREEASATIYFHGLLALCFNEEKKCIVGVNSKAPMHKVNVQVRKVGALPCKKIPILLVPDFQEMRIEVENAVESPVKSGVWVYAPVTGIDKPDPNPTDGRYSYVYYGLDMEGPELHDTFLPKAPGALSPRFSIDNGLFYTCKISTSEFKLEHGVDKKDKRVGLVLAADIYLDPAKKGKITFTCDSEPTPRLILPEEEGKRYEIAITNSCGRSGDDPVPPGTSVTDFQMQYEVIDKAAPAYTDQFDLNRTKIGSATGAIKLGACEMDGIVFSDPAPCLPVTFGQSTNLD